MRRTLLLLALVGVPLAVAAVAIGVWAWPADLADPLAEPRDPVLPDLAMSPLSELTGALADDGDRYVQFTASIGNVGAGPFVIHAERAEERGDWRMSQRFEERDGDTTETITPGTLDWGGHGHDHWHVQLGASYWLTRPGSDVILRKYEKVGYCFFDQSPLDVPGARPTPEFLAEGCAIEDGNAITMGLSSGWADPYPWTLPDQRLNVNGLAEGVYRLWATADPGGWFREADETNNLTWVDLRLSTRDAIPAVAIVRQGPVGAPEPGPPA
jgi:hypothetical protein